MDARKEQPPRWAVTVNTFNTYWTNDLLGGPKVLKTAWVINLHKIFTPVVVVLMMLAYRDLSTAAWLYLALHGSYCLCWLVKHVAFRDPKWDSRVTYGGAAFTFILLATYWVAPFVLISKLLPRDSGHLPNWLAALCVALLVLGVTLMMCADCQKRFTLAYRPGLITEGLFSVVRHPNYLGEMLVYTSLALLAQHWIPWLVLAYWWGLVFLPNMLLIDASVSRYPEWKNYRQRTGMLLPRLRMG